MAAAAAGPAAPPVMAPLREELALFPGPALSDGQPSWTLHDPIRNQFFRIDWLSFEIISRWEMAEAAAIAADISRQTTLQVLAEDVLEFTRFLHDNQLLQRLPGSATAMAAQVRQRKGGFWHNLLHGYLFFRVPLVRPDAWLQRTQSWVAPLFSKGFAWLTLMVLVLGLILVEREWTRFTSTLIDTFSWQGLAGYGVTIVLIKILHELGHAYTAKRYGCRIPAMGVAFLVMFPMAYTDTNEVWKLARHKQRLAVASAGVATELVVAAWATLAWALLPDGLPKSCAFMLATTTWIATLAINTSPFMRFDGYFLLSDWLDMPNLHGRSFALARWHMREKLFGLGLEPPEYFSPSKTLGLILFAYATWLYRLVLFLGIAVLVYHFFIKAVGIVLFIVEIGWFVLMPLIKEVRLWPQLLTLKGSRRGLWRLALIVLPLVLLLVVPLPTRVGSSGLLRPAESFPVHAPAGAQLVSLSKANGEPVRAGEVMLELASPDLQRRWSLARTQLETIRQQAANTGIDPALRQNMQLLAQQESTARAELASVQAELARYAPRAPFDGVLYNLEPGLKPGVWVSAHERLATLVQPGIWRVETYLDEDDVRRIKVGDRARFYADGRADLSLSLRVEAIEQDATRQLLNGELSSAAGGSVMTRDKHGKLIPERAVYRVTLSSEQPPELAQLQSWRGKVVIAGDWQSLAQSFLRSVLVVIWRETGF
ncbi:HlyD family efflux transporter periplasmic adaptor subunit [Pseudomonas sp. 21LCFQ02]|uniref:HlyD family efflux transporter periplasmic adaptor subunit n=1 Tax=Pseudomonas sp. 21LCFQ02 TaxID=2957505 RepID=UPI00209B3117|nr:HlyD family efflux transporter periplasmic adaptor subunit [Pseudomonas sp. 21LCFQ02]MCO8169980.1 HlyD family efflux transporter periplasmic adaptor subunit [Pseudomonas sp. 21LCFQ02]